MAPTLLSRAKLWLKPREKPAYLYTLKGGSLRRVHFCQRCSV